MKTSTEPSQSIDVGTSRLGYRRFGQGPDLVLVHGWPLHGATWRHVVPRLADAFTCHVLDLPGAGESEWTSATPFTIAAHAAAVATAVERLGLDRIGFVAHDSGGAIARLVAADLGDRCFGLALGNTEIPGHHPPMLELMLRLSKFPGGASLLPTIMRFPWLRRSSLGFGGCFTDKSLIDGEFGELFVQPLLRSKRVAEGQLGLVKEFDWSVLDSMAKTHARITAPVALIWGAEDPWFPLERARGMMGQLAGGCELHELRGKLFVHEEQPEVWGDLAKRFLLSASLTAGRPARQAPVTSTSATT